MIGIPTGSLCSMVLTTCRSYHLILFALDAAACLLLWVWWRNKRKW